MTTTAESPPVTPDFDGICDVPEAARYLKDGQCWTSVYSVSSAMMIRCIRGGVASVDLVELSRHELLIGPGHVVAMRVTGALRAAEANWSATRDRYASDGTAADLHHAVPEARFIPSPLEVIEDFDKMAAAAASRAARLFVESDRSVPHRETLPK